MINVCATASLPIQIDWVLADRLLKFSLLFQKANVQQTAILSLMPRDIPNAQSNLFFSDYIHANTELKSLVLISAL